MNHAEAIVLTLMGLAAIWGGLIGGDFYALGPAQKLTPKTKKIPNWIGRSWFLLVGAVILCTAIPRLRGAWQWSDIKGARGMILFLGGACVLNWAFGRSKDSDPPNDVQTLGLDRNR